MSKSAFPCAAALAVGLTACGYDAHELREVGESASGLYVAPGVTLWTARQNVVPVCWSTADEPGDRRLIREAVERTWQKQSTLRFTGWADCPTDGAAQFVRVRVNETRDAWWGLVLLPAADTGLCRYPLGVGNLRTASQGDSIVLDIPDVFPRNVGRIEYLAVHEFGHSLGFAHEQERPDNPDDRMLDPEHCRTARVVDGGVVTETTPGGEYQSGYDRDSIMHYCNRFNNSRGYLSPTDISGLQRVYGRPTASVRAFDGRCLDVQWNNDAERTPVWNWTCGTSFAGTEAQAFSYRPTTKTFVRPVSGRVLDITNRSTAVGAPVEIRSPTGNIAQQWTWTGTEIRGIGGLCATIEAGVPPRVVLRECQALPSQKFELRSDGSLRSNDPAFAGKCLEVKDTRTADGTPIVVGTCQAGQARQVWNVLAGGQIAAYTPPGYLGTLPATALCLDADVPDVLAFDGKGGNALQIWRCNGRLNQRRSFAGPVRGQLGKCLGVRGGVKADGTAVEMQVCDASEKQTFEYFP